MNANTSRDESLHKDSFSDEVIAGNFSDQKSEIEEGIGDSFKASTDDSEDSSKAGADDSLDTLPSEPVGGISSANNILELQQATHRDCKKVVEGYPTFGLKDPNVNLQEILEPEDEEEEPLQSTGTDG
jgi:hypothetical protein